MRTTINLNGTWDFVADLDPKYHAIHGGFHKPDANRRHWLKVPVPGVWQNYDKRYEIFEGVCWLAREFEAPEIPSTALARLKFGAVNYLCRVFLNGAEIGGHEGGYTEFVLDATGKLKTGVNHIAVQVDNRATTIKWPTCLGYFNYGGIHRNVSLEIIDGSALDDLRLEAVPAGKGWELAVSGRMTRAAARSDSADTSDALIVRVCGNGVSREEHVGAEGALAMRVPFFDAPAWSPEHPQLVPITVELVAATGTVIDRKEFLFGFRNIAFSNGKVHLNGRPYPLKGICYVYDSPVHGLVMSDEQIETDLRLMKEMGCNAVRCHYPMDEKFYSACDRLGLLVWIEPPVYCYHPADEERRTRFADPVWLEIALQMAREMIATARNHPCVAIYGIGNECNTQNPEAEHFFRRLAAEVRKMDSTRLISYAALYGNVGPIADIVDVLGINSYWGWYDRIFKAKRPNLELEEKQVSKESGEMPVKKEAIELAAMRKMLDDVLARKANIALLLTEFGADSVPGFFSGSRDLWSEDYHADLLRSVFALAAEYPQIAGTFPFCFSDYRDPSKVPNGYWNEYNLKGVVSYTRRPKLAFDAVKERYKHA